MAPVKLRGRGSMCAAAVPSPAPPSPWQPAHHLTYTALPLVVSCEMRDARCGMRAVTISPAATSQLIMSASRIPHLASRLLPRPRRPPRLIVQEQDHRPDFALREEILPLRHRRVPRRALARQPGAALGHAPEHEALGELRDGAVVLEVGRKRIEAGREVPQTVEVVAVTRQAVPVVDALPLGQIDRERIAVRAQRVLEA